MDEAKRPNLFFSHHRDLLFALVDGASINMLEPVVQELGIRKDDPFDITLRLLAPGGERAYDVLIDGYARFGKCEFADEETPRVKDGLSILRRLSRKRVLRNFRKMLNSVSENSEKHNIPILYLGSIWATQRSDRQKIMLACKQEVQQLIARRYPDYAERIPVQDNTAPFGEATPSAGEVTRVAKIEMLRAAKTESELLLAYRQQEELREIITELERKNLMLQRESQAVDRQRLGAGENQSDKPIGKRRTVLVKPQKPPNRRHLEENIVELEAKCYELERALYPEEEDDDNTEVPLQLDGLKILLVGMYDASRVRGAVEKIGGQLLHTNGHDSVHAANLSEQADMIVFAVGQPSFACFCACKEIARKRGIKYLHWSKKKSIPAFLNLIYGANNRD